MNGIAVVTGASSGIGAATARSLSKHFKVYCVARRSDRIEALAAEIGGVALQCDVGEPSHVSRLANAAGDRVDLLVNNAGGALGQEPLATDELSRWESMYKTNVLGSARVTQALLPALREAQGTVIFMSSTAAEAAYEGGGGYCGVKSAVHSMAGALRLELVSEPVRVCEISPGMVHTEEFSLTRFNGDRSRADAVYEGVQDPLVAEDIADAILWIATRPPHVNIDRMVIRPRAQAANHKVFRTT